jgi:hypothetical protein
VLDGEAGDLPDGAADRADPAMITSVAALSLTAIIR